MQQTRRQVNLSHSLFALPSDRWTDTGLALLMTGGQDSREEQEMRHTDTERDSRAQGLERGTFA